MPPFQPGHKSPGRRVGARDKISRAILKDLIDVWHEPSSTGSKVTRGVAALRLMAVEEPTKFAQLYAGLLPRELHVGHLDDVADDDLDTMIERLKTDLLAAGTEPKLLELKPVDYAEIDRGE